jgi:hypothetical protein
MPNGQRYTPTLAAVPWPLGVPDRPTRTRRFRSRVRDAVEPSAEDHALSASGVAAARTVWVRLDAEWAYPHGYSRR